MRLHFGRFLVAYLLNEWGENVGAEDPGGPFLGRIYSILLLATRFDPDNPALKNSSVRLYYQVLISILILVYEPKRDVSHAEQATKQVSTEFDKTRKSQTAEQREARSARNRAPTVRSRRGMVTDVNLACSH